MPSIYELNKEQESLLDMLYWDPSPENEEEIIERIFKIKGDIIYKVEYMAKLLCEARAYKESIQSASDNINEKLNKAYEVEERLKKYIISGMQAANINKIQIPEVTITKQTGQEKLVYPKDFDVMILARDLLREKTTYSPISERVKEYIKQNANNNLGIKIVRDDFIKVKI